MSNQPDYKEYFVTFPQWQEDKKDGFAKIVAENLEDAGVVIESKIGLDFAAVYEEKDFLAYADRRLVYPKGETSFAVVNHGGRKIILNNDPLENRQVVFCDGKPLCKKEDAPQHGKDSVFWVYELTGAHDGEPIYIAVKNVQKDFDTSGMCANDDGKFWADDLTPLDDLVEEWYDGVLGEAIEADFFESYEEPMSHFYY